MSRRRGTALLGTGVVVLAPFVVAGACATSPASLGYQSEAGADATGPEVAVDAADGAPPPLFDAVNDSTPTCYPCSADLHSVVDCSGNVVRTCPADQGCANGQCVAPCDAANANQSSFGCEFYSLMPEGFTQYWHCFAAYVVNTWGTPISIGVGYQGQALDISQFARTPTGSGRSITWSTLPGGQLPAGQVAALFLSDTPGMDGACPKIGITAPHKGANVAGTALGDAFQITTSAPAVAYDIYPFGGSTAEVTSATLLLPTSSWGTNYMGISSYAPSLLTGIPPALQIVAAQDGTHVTIKPTSPIAGGPGVAPAPVGLPTTYTLDAGQILEFALVGATLDGSPIASDKPIGLWASQSCFNVDESVPYCDSAHQELPPVRALGTEYVGVRYRNRIPNTAEEAPPWRMVGVVDGTTLSWSPSAPPSAPTALAAGQVAKFYASGPFVVRSQDSQHPFYAAAYMTGCGMVGDTNGAPPGCPGDPEFVNVVPAREYLSSYTFFTDPTYPETDLVLVRSTSDDVVLDCAGALGGWQAIAGTPYQWTRFDLVTGNFEKNGSCDNGTHQIHSASPFGLTVWGWGTLATGTGNGADAGVNTQYVSYAYPAGESVQPINSVVVNPK
jgi:hypothetical protein